MLSRSDLERIVETGEDWEKVDTPAWRPGRRAEMPRHKDLPVIDLSGLDLKGQMRAWEEIAIRGARALIKNEKTVPVAIRADDSLKALVRAVKRNLEVANAIEAWALSVSLWSLAT